MQPVRTGISFSISPVGCQTVTARYPDVYGHSAVSNVEIDDKIVETADKASKLPEIGRHDILRRTRRITEALVAVGRVRVFSV